MTPLFFTTAAALPRGTKKRDTLRSAYAELFYLEHPTLDKKNPKNARDCATFVEARRDKGVWVYYPWRHHAVRIPPEAVYYILRTARNRDLITTAEQRAFRALSVGIAGLSVGSAVLASIGATGGPKRVKIADPDYIEITNLNRIKGTLLDIGENKTRVAARALWELDPFAKLTLVEQGLNSTTLKRFVSGLDVCVDEMDDIALKVAIRYACRAQHTPVVMATDNGDSVIVDIERFDQEPRRPIFHGAVEIREDELATFTRAQFIALSTRIINPAFFTPRQQRSILQIGSTLAGVPQLGTAATIAGAAVSYALRRIATKEPMPSGRYVLGLEEAMIPGYTSAGEKKKRTKATKTFITALKKRGGA